MNRRFHNNFRFSETWLPVHGVLFLSLFLTCLPLNLERSSLEVIGLLRFSGTMLTSFRYSDSNLSLRRGETITDRIPEITGRPTSCISIPELPAGLQLEATTCRISGTPTAILSSTNYEITASNAGGSVSTIISIAIIADAIANSLTTSLSAYNTAAINDLVKITLTEYNAISSSVASNVVGYQGAVDNSSWATSIAGGQTYAYLPAFIDVNTITTIPPSSYVVLFTFVPALNPQNSFSCQLKYNNGGIVTNLSNVYSGSTIAVSDRQYFVIKKPSTPVSSSGSNYLAFFSTSGIGTLTLVSHDFNFVTGNVVGAQSFSIGSAASTQYPTMQARSTLTKQW